MNLISKDEISFYVHILLRKILSLPPMLVWALCCKYENILLSFPVAGSIIDWQVPLLSLWIHHIFTRSRFPQLSPGNEWSLRVLKASPFQQGMYSSKRRLELGASHQPCQTFLGTVLQWKTLLISVLLPSRSLSQGHAYITAWRLPHLPQYTSGISNPILMSASWRT